MQNKIEKSCDPYRKKLEKETDELKRIKLGFKITKISLSILFNEMKKLSDSEWEKFTEEYFEPVVKHSESISDRFDDLIMKQSKDSKEYEKYRKMKEISIKGNKEILDVIDNISLNKKELERLLVIIFRVMIHTDNSLRQNNIDFYEFNEAGNVVRRRLGFDYNWLVCLSLIQLYENMIRKKISYLGYTIQEKDTVDSLIPQLVNRIKEKENRDVSLALKMSDGLKRTRNLMTHQGYKQAVLKSDLERIFAEIVELERTLYPEK